MLCVCLCQWPTNNNNRDNNLNSPNQQQQSHAHKSADRELYSSLANATLSFLRAGLTLEQADLQAALAAVNQSFNLSARRRRKTSMVMRLLYRPNYNHYTDDEIHAELVHAESLLLLALISFIADQSIICLVRGAFRIRACYQSYKECLHIMENRQNWASDEARKHFESGVRMGHGIFNLLMSYLPRRVLRFLEYVGFSGNRSVGVDELDRSIELHDGLRSVFSALVILTYHSYVENLFGLGSYDADRVKQLITTSLGNYPNSAFFLLFLGRYNQMLGDLDGAIDSFQQCIEAQNDWKQFHSICHWEIMWCHAVQMDWKRAAHYSDLLRRHSKWSQASYTYQYATFLYAQLVEDQRQGSCDPNSEAYSSRMSEIREIMETVPGLRIRYAGKTIPAEKFAITRSIKFCQQSNRLTLPALEFLYIWNVFATVKNCPKQVEQLLGRIDSEIEHINKIKSQCETTIPLDNGSASGDTSDASSENDDDDDDEQITLTDNWDDDLGLALLLRGMCLKHLKRLDEAEESFMQVIDSESNIKSDTFLAPHTAMELALLKLTTRDFEGSNKWIKQARTNYTGYLLETIVHFRLHAASRLIRLEQKDLLSSSSCELSSTEYQAAAAVESNKGLAAANQMVA